MRALILCALIAVASAQFPFFHGFESDRHNGYTFQYHTRTHLLLVRDGTHCYIINGSQAIADKYNDQASQDTLEDNIIAHIKDSSNLHKESTFEALGKHHDILTAAECRHKTIYELTFSL